jgi:tetratricopeptide (TPR) repeat protein
MRGFSALGQAPLVAGALAVVLLVYANSLDNGFHFDDEHSLVKNPHVRTLENIPRFFTDTQMFSRNVGSQMYRPLVLLSYALNFRVGGYAGRGYHWVNLGIHLGVVALAFATFVHLGAQHRLAALGALLFGLHPLTAEPVNYISSRSESLSALFCLGGFLLYARGALILSLLCFAAGLLSKSTALVLPLLVLGYEVCWRRSTLRTCWRQHWPYWAVGGAYLAYTRELIAEALLEAPVRSWASQAGTQLKALVYYLKLVVLPRPLSVEHQFFAAESTVDGVVLAAAVLGLALGVLVAWRARGRQSQLAFWILWSFIGLLPTLVVPLNVLVNERRLYLPLIGCAGIVLVLAQERGGGKKALALLAAGLAMLGSLSAQRNRAWASEWALWEDARQKAPLMVRPYLRLGTLHRQAGQLAQAEAAYEQALALNPDHAAAHNNLGNVYRLRGDHQSAETAYKKALEILPSYAEAMINLATLYSERGQYAKALVLYQQALPISANREEVYNNLGTHYLRMGEYVRAEEALRQALEIDDGSALIYFNLGGALEGQGSMAQAEAAYEQALRRDPAHAKAHFKLAILLEQSGRKGEAMAAYARFLRHWDGDPGLAAEARRRLGELERAQSR